MRNRNNIIDIILLFQSMVLLIMIHRSIRTIIQLKINEGILAAVNDDNPECLKDRYWNSGIIGQMKISFNSSQIQLPVRYLLIAFPDFQPSSVINESPLRQIDISVSASIL
jgi:hypothetical protein